MTQSAPSTPAIVRWLARAAFVAGLLLAAAAVSSWQVPVAGGSTRVDVTFTTNLTGELGASPTGVLIRRRAMEAGTPRRSAGGGFSIRNQTPVVLAVGLRARPDSRDLDRLLAAKVTMAGKTVFSGRLGVLRRGSRRVRIAPGQERSVRVRAWLPGGPARYAQRSQQIALELTTRPVPR